jgi:hypothetical protein
VDTEGPQTEHIQGEAPNVVRLPVDWLGPRDELVPIGPPRDEDASSRGDQTAEGPDRRQLRALTEQPTMPPSAADFWGERAEAVQDVLQGPAPAPPAPSDVEARPSARDDMEARPSARDDMEARPRARDNVEPPPPTEPTEPPSLTLPSRGTKRARAMAQRAADWQRRALSSAQWGRLTAAAGVIAIAGVAALIGANVLTSSPGGSAISRKTASTSPRARELHPVFAPAPAIPPLLANSKHRASTRRHAHTAHRQEHTSGPSTGHSGSGGGATPVRYASPYASSGSGGSSSSSGSSTSRSAGSSSPSISSGSAGGSSGTSSSSSSGSAPSSGTAAPRQSDSSARSASASHSSSSTSATGASGALGPIGSPNG